MVAASRRPSADDDKLRSTQQTDKGNSNEPSNVLTPEPVPCLGSRAAAGDARCGKHESPSPENQPICNGERPGALKVETERKTNMDHTQTQNSLRFQLLLILSLTTLAMVLPSSAQTHPSLRLSFSAGQPTLSLTGATGTVYCIEFTDGLSSTNVWMDRTLLQTEGATNVWTDPSAPLAVQRFYRAVPIAAPANTNLVFIQPGTFTMGSPTNDGGPGEHPQTVVTISRGFWIGKYLVTQGEYQAVVGSNPSYFTSADGFSDDPALPVESLSWYDATKYCALRTQQEQAAGLIASNLVYRLPTEAEWEYVCRAGTTTEFSYGDDPGYTNLVNYSWYVANSGGMSHPVGQKLPNPWGLYDVHGDVYEWCLDWLGTYPGGTVLDPQGTDPGGWRGARGGGLANDAPECRSANRFYVSPYLIEDDLGFRVVLAQSPVGAGTYAVLNRYGGVAKITAPSGGVSAVISTAAATGMTLDNEGNYILAAVNSLLKVKPDGSVSVIASAPSGSQFIDVACDIAGNYIIMDNTRHRILRISSDGSTTTNVASYPVQDVDNWEDACVRVLGNGNYLLAEYNELAAHLFIITPTGNVTNIQLTGVLPSGVGDLCLDSFGNYIITDYNNANIDKITPSGICSTLVHNFNFSEITGITWDQRNNTFIVTDSGNNTLYSIASDGSSVTQILSGLVLSEPNDVAVIPMDP
jgi:formylglycine-generating enzyme required for sulfatase activity